MGKNKQLYIAIPLALFLIFGFAFMTIGHPIAQPIGPNEVSSPINYQAYVCVSKNGKVIGCDHNTLFNVGAEDIEQILGVGVNYSAFNYIYLCNATAGCGTPSAGETEDYNQYSAGGLTGGAGTYSSNGNGNWTISKTFTATADSLETNVTKLGNSTGTAGTYLAGNSFTLTTLQTNDQLTINWTIWVS